MRIEKIRIFNINSLKGIHEIDFQNEPLKSSGLFAITGPTGSGKSTILDVIMLGLFNYIPRLDGTISSSKVEKLGTIVTHYCNEAWVEVEYSCTKGSFRSRWSIQKKKRAQGFGDYNMDLIELPEEKSLGLKKSDIPSQNSMHIGLNAKQFLKTILLSQGGFARFLRAKKEDRTKLLEEITGAKIYREIGKKAFERKAEHVQLIKDKELTLSSINLLAPEEINALNHDLSLANKNLSSLKSQKARLTSIIEILHAKENLNKHIVSVDATRLELSTTKQLFSSIEEAAHAHDKVFKHFSSINSLNNLKQSILQKEQDINKLLMQIKSDKSQISASIDLASNLTHDSLTHSSFLTKIASFRTLILSKDQEINQALTQGKTLRNNINDKLHSANYTFDPHQIKIDPDHAINLLKKKKNTLSAPENQSRNSLQNTWESLNTQILHTNSIIQKNTELNTLSLELKTLQHTIDSLHKTLTKEEKSLEPIPELINDLKEKHTSQKNTQIQLVEKGKWKAELEKLEDGDPCPVCGSTSHPYASHKEITDISIIAAELIRIEKEIENISRQETQIKENINKTRANIDRYEDERIKIDSKIKTKSSEIEDLINTHEFLGKDLDHEKNLVFLQSELAKTKSALSDLDESLLIDDLLKSYESLSNSINLYKQLFQERQKIYTGKDISEEVDNIQDQFNLANERVQLQSERLEKYKKQLELDKKECDELRSSLDVIVKEMKVQEAEDLLPFILPESELQKIKTLKEKLISLSSSLETKQERLKTDKKAYQTLLAETSDEEKALLDEESVELKIKFDKLEKEEARTNELVGRIAQKLAYDNAQIERQAGLISDLEETKKAARKHIVLAEILGDKNGKNWAAYAQNLTFMQLISRANARLESLTDRYLLYFNPEEDSLIVIDRYAGDKMRSVETLSGGETFLLSLALALSLSDFASNNISIESLFIDEGFATLDNETLDSVMTTLEKLQDQSGKIIGIISHVESLKERINTQIKVHKSAEGYSTIEIV